MSATSSARSPWPSFAASVATKVVHRKLRELIPILDNEAILGAYMNPIWPERRASIGHVYPPIRIRESARLDLVRPHPSGEPRVWPALSGSHPARSRIELVDLAWWMHSTCGHADPERPSRLHTCESPSSRFASPTPATMLTNFWNATAQDLVRSPQSAVTWIR